MRLVKWVSALAALIGALFLGMWIGRNQPVASGPRLLINGLPVDVATTVVVVGILAIAVSWVTVIVFLTHKGQLELLARQVQYGPLIKFVTVTYIVVVIVALSILGRLEGDKVATLLGSIVGFVLGGATSGGADADTQKRQPPSTGGRSG